MLFKIDQKDSELFGKCVVLEIQGYTVTGLSSVVITELQNSPGREKCTESLVVDAVGDQLPSSKIEIINCLYTLTKIFSEKS
jgi:hypothetical protein